MKYVLLFFVFFATLLHTAFAQLLLEENFDYEFGALTNVGGNANVSGGIWVNFSGGPSNYLPVMNGNLAYTNYPSSDIGHYVTLSTGNAEDAYTQFATQTSGKIYASFLIDVSGVGSLPAHASTTGDHFAGFFPSASTSLFTAMIVARRGTATDTYNLGLRATTSNSSAVFHSTDYNRTTGEVHLIVISYEFVSGATNDVVNMWIDPDLSGSEPTPLLTQTSAADVNDVSRFYLRQNFNTIGATIDGIRVATAWSQAPLPVELVEFNAQYAMQNIKLNWTTATEVNNYGFEIEKAVGSSEYRVWSKIGFVEGNGTTNAPKNYSFTDIVSSSEKYSYRLKQIDHDGKFSYSQQVEVEVGSVPKVFALEQNYPNPFNPTTVINYQLPVNSFTTLKVYDALGREVATLVNEMKDAGSYSVTFNAKNLGSGIYFARLSSSGNSQIRKLLLMK